MSEEILNLSTIIDRPTINIRSKKHPKGKLYEVLGLADLSPFTYAGVLQKSKEADDLRTRAESGKRLTPAQERRIDKALDDVVAFLMPSLEPTVRGELTRAQKEQIVLVWSSHAAAESTGKA